MSPIERRLTKKGEKRRSELLDAALELFGTRGYHATTMDDIAAAVGTGKGTVYWYWPGKEDIFADLVRIKFEAYGEALNRAVSMQVPAPEKLLLLVAEMSRLMEKYRKFCKLIFLLISDQRERFNPAIHESISRYYETFHQVIAHIVAQGQAEGSLRPGLDSDHVASLLIAVLDGIIMQEALTGASQSLEVLGASLLGIFRQGLYINGGLKSTDKSTVTTGATP